MAFDYPRKRSGKAYPGERWWHCTQKTADSDKQERRSVATAVQCFKVHFEKIATDIAVPFPKTDRVYKYIQIGPGICSAKPISRHCDEGPPQRLDMPLWSPIENTLIRAEMFSKRYFTAQMHFKNCGSASETYCTLSTIHLLSTVHLHSRTVGTQENVDAVNHNIQEEQNESIHHRSKHLGIWHFIASSSHENWNSRVLSYELPYLDRTMILVRNHTYASKYWLKIFRYWNSMKKRYWRVKRSEQKQKFWVYF